MMIVTLHTGGLRGLEEIRAFLSGNLPFEFRPPSRAATLEWIAQELRRLAYLRLRRVDRGDVRTYLQKISGLSRAQLTRRIRQFSNTGKVVDRRAAPARPFRRRYTDADVRLLAEVDTLHSTLSGAATRKLCERALSLFGDERFVRLAKISNGHLYNLRHSHGYQRLRQTIEKTRPTNIRIGERRKPRPEGRPGYLRVDSVHQGDRDGFKGIYLINLVDEVTQFQFVGACPKISERFLLPVMESLLQAFPFVVRGLHADNGSEYINHRVAAMLQKLNITEFTKSRARQSSDNALVESKNGSVVRKHLGYSHIAAHWADRVHHFTSDVLSPYLNFHRPCYFPITVTDEKGRERKRYPYENMMTPYQKLQSLPDATTYLRDGISFDKLDALAFAQSDNDAARIVTQTRTALFQHINRARDPAA